MWTKKELVATVASRLTAKPVQVQREEAEEYLQLSKEIGIKTTTTYDLELLLALEELGIPIYPQDEVNKYFHEVRKLNWSWYRITPAPPWTVFEGQVPLRIMHRIAQVRRRLPNAIFHVAAPGLVSKDPFLGVSLGGSIFVIDYWDEPDFPFPIVP